MRTTLTIEPAIAAQIRRRMERRQQTLKSAVNEILRDGLRASEQKSNSRPNPFKVKAHPLGLREGIDLDKISHFADQIEDEARIAKMVVDAEL